MTKLPQRHNGSRFFKLEGLRTRNTDELFTGFHAYHTRFPANARGRKRERHEGSQPQREAAARSHRQGRPFPTAPNRRQRPHRGLGRRKLKARSPTAPLGSPAAPSPARGPPAAPPCRARRRCPGPRGEEPPLASAPPRRYGRAARQQSRQQSGSARPGPQAGGGRARPFANWDSSFLRLVSEHYLQIK